MLTDDKLAEDTKCYTSFILKNLKAYITKTYTLNELKRTIKYRERQYQLWKDLINTHGLIMQCYSIKQIRISCVLPIKRKSKINHIKFLFTVESTADTNGTKLL